MFQAEYAKLAHTLLKYGVGVNTQNKNGLTRLRLARQGRLAKIERILFQHGADFGAHDNMNQIPFCGVYCKYTVKRSSWGAKVVEIVICTG